MKKTPIYFAMLIIGMAGAFSINTFSQKIAVKAKEATAVKSPLERYIEVSSLPMDQRRKIFSEITPEERAVLQKCIWHFSWQNGLT